jgi:SAM-dependent methyltransferase
MELNEKQAFFDRSALEYDRWFDRHEAAFRSELLALQPFLLKGVEGLEIGIGTGRFAAELGIGHGVEPAPGMAAMARERGVEVKEGVAEELPYPDERFDQVLMVTVDCFLDDTEAAYSEAYRVLRPGGRIVIGQIDREGIIAQKYESKKAPDNAYWYARFHTPDETAKTLRKAGFDEFEYARTLRDPDPETQEDPGLSDGEGGFVVIKAIKTPGIG